MIQTVFQIALVLLAAPGQSPDARTSPPRRPELPGKNLEPGEWRILESYPKHQLTDGLWILDYFVVGPDRPLRLRVGGPASLIVTVRGLDWGPMTLSLGLDSDRTDQTRLEFSPFWSRNVPFRVPPGTHVITLTPGGEVLVRVAKVAAFEAKEVASAEKVEPRQGTPGPPSWGYQPGQAGPAEEPETGRRLSFWVTAGVGGGAQLDPATGGMSWGVGLNLGVDFYQVTLRYVHCLEMEDQIAGPLPTEEAWEVSPLFGVGLQGEWGWFSGAAGIGLVGGIRRGEFLQTSDTGRDLYESADFLTVGFPLDVQFFLHPFSCLGLGINAFANLNFERSFFGALVAVQLGRF